MIVYHGTTEINAREIVSKGWNDTIAFFASTNKDYALGYARRTWLSNTKDRPVLLVIEVELENILMTNLTRTNGELIIKDPSSIKIIQVEVMK